MSAKKPTVSNLELITREKPYPDWIKEHLPFDPEESTFIEIRGGDQLYELASDWIVTRIDQSFRVRPKANTSAATRALEKMARIAAKAQANGKYNPPPDAEKEDAYKTELSLGLGFLQFEFKNNQIYGVHQTIGEPESVGYCGEPRFFHSLILFVKGKGNIQILQNLCDQIVIDNESKKDILFVQIFRYNADNGYWQNAGRKIGRNVSTIILPEIAKKAVMSDIERFLDLESVKWYFQHGIPYKRSYLFYGVPGSGKTSFIQALAAKFERNLCFLQPTHPKMTDDNFKTCIQSVPANSLIVLEDIDALFNKDRSKKHEQCPLTFSGLLNGLDGVGNPDGQIFVLTTNFVDQLDEALIRSGRVDVHVQFPMATDPQLEQMFLLFYPEETTLAQEFTSNIRKHFPSGISMAAVQQHFISMMFVPANEVVAAVADLGDRLDVAKQLQKRSELPEEEEKEEKKEEEKDQEKKSEETDKELLNLLKGLDKSVFVDQLKKIPEMKPTIIDFFTKQIDRFTKPAEPKEEKEANETAKEKSKEQ